MFFVPYAKANCTDNSLDCRPQHERLEWLTNNYQWFLLGIVGITILAATLYKLILFCQQTSNASQQRNDHNGLEISVDKSYHTLTM